MTRSLARLRRIALAAALSLIPSMALAQESKSATSVTELVKMLESMKLDSFAVKGTAPNEYVGALYLAGSQLLVVSAKFDTPYRADSLLAQKNYRDVYIELNSASLPESKTFVSDLGADGLRYKKDGNLYDTVDVAGKTYAFDGDWKKAKISEDDYSSAYSTSDQHYNEMIEALLAGLKKPS